MDIEYGSMEEALTASKDKKNSDELFDWLSDNIYDLEEEDINTYRTTVLFECREESTT